MITQKFKNGRTEIVIESAESLDDAKQNGFAENEFTRYILNGKKADGYMTMINCIIDETRRSGQSFIPSNDELKKMRDEMMRKNAESMGVQLAKMRSHYKEQGLPTQFIDEFDKFTEKLDLAGVRIKE